jgi:hypothetical protein
MDEIRLIIEDTSAAASSCPLFAMETLAFGFEFGCLTETALLQNDCHSFESTCLRVTGWIVKFLS